MKRVLGLTLSALLVVFATNLFAADAKRLAMATGGTAGIYFPLGGAIAQVLSNKSGGALSVTAQATGASGENVRLLNKNEVDIAIVQNDVADTAFKGLEPFREKLSNMRAILRLYPEHLQVVATRESGIKSMEDFKGKKISVGARGAGNEVNARQIFEFYGLNYTNLTPIFLPYSETADQFKDRQIDGFIFSIGAPNPAIQDITTSREVTFVPLEGKKADAIAAKFPYLTKGAIPANTYKGQSKSIPTLSVQALLLVNKDMSDETAYLLTKTLMENLQELARAHAKGAEITLKQAAEGVTLPFHPGAQKYLKEKAVLK